jgi:ElaB/YqjD/DUF883 family membrane-anchored ribosome-binding protein
MQTNMTRVVQQLNRTVSDAGAMLDAGADKLSDARDALAVRLDRARDRLKHVEIVTARKVRIAAHRTERYARDHPWQVAGIAVAVVVAVGIAIGIALGSRKD